jgi:hypothetical protein
LLVARANAGRHAQLVLGRTQRREDRGQRREDLTAALMRRRDLSADLFGDKRAIIAEGRCDRRRVHHAIERAAERSNLEREAEGVGRHVLQAMCLVDHEVVRLRQQRSAHSRVL